jgi:hypothetical protein
VFLRAFQGLHRLRDPRAFRSWLLGIAHNRTLEHLRERLRLRILDDTALELLFEGSQLAILEGDDDDARRPIAYLAAQAGKNEGAVRVMLFRLRETLRDCVRARAAGRGQK